MCFPLEGSLLGRNFVFFFGGVWILRRRRKIYQETPWHPGKYSLWGLVLWCLIGLANIVCYRIHGTIVYLLTFSPWNYLNQSKYHLRWVWCLMFYVFVAPKHYLLKRSSWITWRIIKFWLPVAVFVVDPVWVKQQKKTTSTNAQILNVGYV